MALVLSVLGEFHLELDGKPITAFESNKVRGLLAYLAVESGPGGAFHGARPVDRSFLASLLWPDHPEQAARVNLRHVLRQLRQTLPDLGDAPPLLLVTARTLQFNPQADFSLDTTRFHELLDRCAACNHQLLESCPDCIERYRQAVELYRGDFLADLSLNDTDVFEEWMILQRERFHRTALEILFVLASHFEKTADWQQAKHYANRQLELEPWREEAHRQMMRILARSGERSAALVQYERCRTLLMEKLGVEPSLETRTLYEQIRLEGPGEWQNRGATGSDLALKTTPYPLAPAPVSTISHQDWGEAPLTLYVHGRHKEQEILRHWLLDERCRLITVVGIGGMGKTTLVTRTAKMLQKEFQFIFWRSLLNAPPLSDILHPCLQFLAHQQLTKLPATLNEQLAMLLEFLSDYRCLLIFDNLESILEAGRAGQYRPGYEVYGQLFDLIGEREHQSCLILTSREQPLGIEQMKEDFPSVRSLALGGLEAEAGQELLRMRGLDSNTSLSAEIVARYSGNPLALKLVARTISEIFDGDIAAFLGDEAVIFDDIRAVLEQQFARLSELEREVLLWLAIARESMSVQSLTSYLLHKPRLGDIVEAMQALQRRTLLERTDNGFTLQNVVTEFATDYIIEHICNEVQTATPFLLERHALLHVQAQMAVQQSQRRLILRSIVKHLEGELGRPGLILHCQRLLNAMRAKASLAPSYAAGNILNLLLCSNIDLTGFNLSRLAVWQASLAGVHVRGVDFTSADLTNSVFTETFGVIHTVAYSADGHWIAAGTWDGEIRIWRAGDRQPIRVIQAHDGPVRALAFHPDGETFASGSDDFTLRLWRTKNGQLLQALRGHRGWVRSVAFSADGAILASGSMDHTVCLWDGRGREQQPLHVLQGHTDAVWCVAFSPDTTARPLLASCGADHTVRLWDAQNGTLLSILRGHTHEVRALAVSPTGRELASGGLDRSLQIWHLNTETGHAELRQTLPGDDIAIRCLAFSPNGKTLAVSGASAAIRLWNMPDGQIRYTLHGHTKGVNSIAFAPNSDTFITGSDDHTLYIWSSRTGHARHALHGYTGWVRESLFSPDGSLLASGSDDTFVRLWDTRTGVRKAILQGHHHWLWRMKFSPDGKILATGGADHLICLWRIDEMAERMQPRHVLQRHTNTIRGLVFGSPPGMGGVLLASGCADAMVHLWDPVAGRHLYALQGHTGVLHSLVFSPDGAILASAGNTINLWDMRQLPSRVTPIVILPGHSRPVRSILFSPDGTLLASASSDNTVCLWNVPSLLQDQTSRPDAPLYEFHGLDPETDAIIISPDGALLAYSDLEHTIRVIHVRSGQLYARLRGHTGAIRQMAFSPDGKSLASCSMDRTVRLWNLEKGADLDPASHVLHGHKHWVWTIAFSPDGAHLASGSVDATIKLWDVASGDCLFTFQPQGPYAGMNITNATGITAAQRLALQALGAVDHGIADQE